MRQSTPASVGAHALIGNPQSLGGGSRLIKDIDGDPAPGIPVAANPQPVWSDGLFDALGDRHRTLLMERPVVTITPQQQLQRFALHQPLIRRVVDDKVRKIRLTRYRAQRRELGYRESREVGCSGMRIGDSFQARVVRCRRPLPRRTQQRQVVVFLILGHRDGLCGMSG